MFKWYKKLLRLYKRDDTRIDIVRRKAAFMTQMLIHKIRKKRRNAGGRGDNMEVNQNTINIKV